MPISRDTATQLPRASRGRPRDPSRDEAILDAAVELLAEVGFERMSVDALAQRAGVGKPSIYRRWPGGKGQVAVEAVLRRRTTRTAPDTGTLRGDLLALVTASVAAFGRDAHLAAGVACRLREDPSFAQLFRDHVVAAERALWDRVVARAEARGELPAGPRTALFSDVAPSLLHARLAFSGEPVDTAFAEELVDRVLLPILLHDHQGTP